MYVCMYVCIVGCRGASQLGGSLVGIPPGLNYGLILMWAKHTVGILLFMNKWSGYKIR